MGRRRRKKRRRGAGAFSLVSPAADKPPLLRGWAGLWSYVEKSMGAKPNTCSVCCVVCVWGEGVFFSQLSSTVLHSSTGINPHLVKNFRILGEVL